MLSVDRPVEDHRLPLAVRSPKSSSSIVGIATMLIHMTGICSSYGRAINATAR